MKAPSRLKNLARHAITIMVFGAGSIAVTTAIAHADTENRENYNETTNCLKLKESDISPNLPSDFLETGSAGFASDKCAADFAWKTFFALNWPSKVDERGVPDRRYQNPLPSAVTTWETMRSKIEVFPGNGGKHKAPHGVELLDGEPINPPNFGYNNPVFYRYSEKSVGNEGYIKACTSQSQNLPPAYVNLDETTQLGINQTFAGSIPEYLNININSKPQLIRYGVKMNEEYYRYVIGQKFWYRDADASSSPLDIAIKNYTNALKDDSKRKKNPQSPFVNLPNGDGEKEIGAILLKSSWRQLTDQEAKSGRFHIQTVRYYEKDTDTNQICFHQAEWGLIGLHITRFTRSAPWGVWATFEQADNILNSDGSPTENADGSMNVQPSPSGGTEPAMVYDAWAPPRSHASVSVKGAYCANPGSRMFFQENPAATSDYLPVGGKICLNQRRYPISDTVVAANQIALETLAKKWNNPNPLPWLHYRLTSVQQIPFPKKQDEAVSIDKSVFYAANATMETDYSLSNFSGHMTGPKEEGKQTFFVPSDLDENGEKYFNTVLLPFQSNGDLRREVPANAGGCAGCHGNAAKGGKDFSFALGSNDAEPELPDAFDSGTGLAKFRRYHND